MYFIFFLLLPVALFAAIDPASRSFELREKRHVDLFDFAGDYPQLGKIDIDARKKMNVEMLLTGTYPVLTKILYEGSFGELKADLTGHFPLLEEIALNCTSAAMTLDFRGKWTQNCDIVITGSTGDISLLLPTDVGVIVHTKTLTGRATSTTLKKKGMGLIHKTWLGPAYSTSPITLTFHIEATSGTITLR